MCFNLFRIICIENKTDSFLKIVDLFFNILTLFFFFPSHSLLVTHTSLLWVNKLWVFTSLISTFVWIHWPMYCIIRKNHSSPLVPWNICVSENFLLASTLLLPLCPILAITKKIPLFWMHLLLIEDFSGKFIPCLRIFYTYLIILGHFVLLVYVCNYLL